MKGDINMIGKNVTLKGLRISAICMILLMSVSLWGCGGDSKETSSATKEKTEETTKEKMAVETADQTPEATETKAETDKGAVKTNVPTELSYESVMTVEGNSINSKVWVKDKKVRSEVETAGTLTVTISDGTDTYVLVPASKTGQKMSATSDTSAAAAELAGANYNADVTAQTWVFDGMEKLGEETVNGMKTTVYNDADSATKYWVSDEYGFPVKFEVTSDDAGVTMEIKNIKVEAIDDSQFEIPSDYTITEVQY